jgi:hypothetical protein
MERALGWRPTRFRPPPRDGHRRRRRAGSLPMAGVGVRQDRRDRPDGRVDAHGASELPVAGGWFYRVLGFDDDGMPRWRSDLSMPTGRRRGQIGEWRRCSALDATPTAPPEHLLVISIDDFSANWRGSPQRPFTSGSASTNVARTNLPALISAAAAAPLAGDSLVHRTSGRPTSASATIGQSSSTGTTPRSPTRTSTSRAGSRASTPRAARRRNRSFRPPQSWQPGSLATSAATPARPQCPGPRTFDRCNFGRREPPSPGRRARWGSSRRNVVAQARRAQPRRAERSRRPDRQRLDWARRPLGRR